MTRKSQSSIEKSIAQSLAWAEDHSYVSGEYSALSAEGNIRKRAEPELRFGLLLNIFIDLSIGKAASNKDASIWHIGHTEIQEAYVLAGQKCSVASVFNYFNDRDTLTKCIVQWAANNLTAENKASRKAAIIVLNQYAAIRPAEAAELGVISMPIIIKESVGESIGRWAFNNSDSDVRLIKNKTRKVLRELA